MAPKRGLGKGLDALFRQGTGSGSEIEDAEDDVMKTGKTAAAHELPGNDGEAGSASGKNSPAEQFIPLDKLKANPDQPRKTFNDNELAELADSIREHGVIQPIIAEEKKDGTYVIVAGERRTRAAKIAGLKEIPAVIRRYSDKKRMIVSLIENVQRADLNPIEEAAAYKRLMEFSGLSQDEAASQVGKNRSTVANALRLLKLPVEMQKSIRDGEISPGHARAILSVPNAGNQEILFREIIKKNLSVREAEKRAALLTDQKKSKNEKSAAKGRPPELGAMEEKFLTHLGTKVKIDGGLNGGTILISYYSMEDLERLYEILGG